MRSRPSTTIRTEDLLAYFRRSLFKSIEVRKPVLDREFLKLYRAKESDELAGHFREDNFARSSRFFAITFPCSRMMREISRSYSSGGTFFVPAR